MTKIPNFKNKKYSCTSSAAVAVLITLDNWSKWRLVDPETQVTCGKQAESLPDPVGPGFSEMALFEKGVSFNNKLYTLFCDIRHSRTYVGEEKKERCSKAFRFNKSEAPDSNLKSHLATREKQRFTKQLHLAGMFCTESQFFDINVTLETGG